MAKVLLVVDDEPYIRSFIKAKLSRIVPDLMIREAADGEQAMEAITSGEVDLVTIDINMPFINGVELISTIKQKGELSQLPIIVVSANVSQSVRDSLTGMGITEIYGKLDITSNNAPNSPFMESVKRYLS